MTAASATIHATAVLVGARAVLIRGPSGGGKSRLALSLLTLGRAGGLALVRLIADDRVRLEAAHGRLIASAPEPLRGLIEVRGDGIQAWPHEGAGVVGWVVDLGSADARRMSEEADRTVLIEGIRLPRLAFPPDVDPLVPLLAHLRNEQVAASFWQTGPAYNM